MSTPILAARSRLVSLEELKEQYLSLDSGLWESSMVTWWRQGQILLAIKAQLKHGEWLPWVMSNLDIGKVAVQERMMIGHLSHLPAQKDSYRNLLRIEALAEVGRIAHKNKLSPEEALAKFRNTNEARNAKAKEKAELNKGGRPSPAPSDKGTTRPPPRPAPAKGMSRQQAFAVLGIDLAAQTITEESLNILFRGLRQLRHPDKGGTAVAFVQLTKAMETLK